MDKENDQVNPDETKDVNTDDKSTDTTEVAEGAAVKEGTKETNWEDKYKEFERGATPKFQRLSELEKQVSQFQSYAELDNWLKENPEKANKFIGFVQELKKVGYVDDTSNNGDDDDPYEKRFKGHEKEISELKKVVFDGMVEKEQNNLKSEISDIKKTYKYVDEKYLLERAMQNPTEPLDPIAKEYNDRIEGIVKRNTVNKDAIIKEYVDGKIKDSKSTIEGKGGNAPIKTGQSLNLKDAHKEAIELLAAYGK
jgi:hypothetical protein